MSVVLLDLTFGLLSWLEALVRNMICYVKTGAVEALNAVIAAIGALLGAIVAVLPTMPTSESFLPENVVHTVNWFYDVGALVTALTTIAGLYLAYLAVGVAARWTKLLGGGS